MPISTIYDALQALSLSEFSDIVLAARVMLTPTNDPLKLRLDIIDGSLLDVFLSAQGRYSYHWERRLTPAGDLYRHDNAPHNKWQHVKTFPKHFHVGSEENVVESYINDTPEDALREILTFARRKLTEH